MKKKNLLVCRSGGRTSEFMNRWLLENKSEEYNIVSIFANTGREHWKTLEFVHKNDIENERLFGVKPIWLEAVTHDGRVACTHKAVDYASADRSGDTFENVIKKYGIPNKAYPHCTRELKENPIHDYIKNVLGWKSGDYETALGMRIDEPKRILGQKAIASFKKYGVDDMEMMMEIRKRTINNSTLEEAKKWDKTQEYLAMENIGFYLEEFLAKMPQKNKKQIDKPDGLNVDDIFPIFVKLNMFRIKGDNQQKVYPLVDWHSSPLDKLDILDWWEDQDFDLGIPEHLGNCTGCFKKSINKVLKVVRDHNLNWERRMEFDYGHVGPNRINGKLSDLPRTMYRQYMTSEKMIALFQVSDMNKLRDDSEEDPSGCSASCEPFGQD